MVIFSLETKLFIFITLPKTKQFLPANSYLCTIMFMLNSQRKITLLEDNHPGAQYSYLIHVQTGHRKNAGTSANVRIFSDML